MTAADGVRWWWVRHGPTHQTAFTGWRDVPADLSDSKALHRLDQYLPRGALLISSDLIRAAATADALSKGRRRLPNDEALREFDFGSWDGRHFSEIEAESPDLWRRYWQTPGATAPPGGESWDAAAARVQAAVDRIGARHSGQDIVAVAHLGVILTQVAAAAPLPAAKAITRRIAPLSVTRIALGPAGARLGPENHLA